MFIFFILITTFILKTIYYFAFREIFTISTCFKLFFLKTAYFYLTFGFTNISIYKGGWVDWTTKNSEKESTGKNETQEFIEKSEKIEVKSEKEFDKQIKEKQESKKELSVNKVKKGSKEEKLQISGDKKTDKSKD